MPWHIETDNAECDGFGVIKDATGELVGCHRTRTQAENHVAALYASEPDMAEDRAAGDPTVIVTDGDGPALRPNRDIAEEILAKFTRVR